VSYVRETMSHRRPWLRMHRWRADESVVECGDDLWSARAMGRVSCVDANMASS
jgi:hypothetical protein